MKLSVILLGLYFLMSPFSYAEEITPTEVTKGCVMKGVSNEGNVVFIFFVKVADSEYDSDEGQSQIWGYNPEDIDKDKEGNIRFRVVLAKNFIKAGATGHLSGGILHCPSW